MFLQKARVEELAQPQRHSWRLKSSDIGLVRHRAADARSRNRDVGAGSSGCEVHGSLAVREAGGN
jgi:hypothetical protein